jgi:hypothetical protein
VTADGAEWTITQEEVAAVREHLVRHFPGGEVRALTEPSDPGQLFQVIAREGTRHSLKMDRAVLDDLRHHRIPIAQFLEKQGIARRMRGARRIVVRQARGEDMIREESA